MTILRVRYDYGSNRYDVRAPILKVRYGTDGYDLYRWGMTILKVRYDYGSDRYDFCACGV